MTSLLWFFLGLVVAVTGVIGAQRYVGFMSQRAEHYETGQPVMDLRQHLNGPIKCEGVIYGPLGRVTSRFDDHFGHHMPQHAESAGEIHIGHGHALDQIP
ncbi:MAG: DUF3833 family protein, partial [Pseudomonadota bacterium]